MNAVTAAAALALADQPLPRRELLLGCGHSRVKMIHSKELGIDTEWHGLVTLDVTAEVKPDVVHDLDKLPLPFDDNSFDEIHAYEVLEHTGAQGDWRFFLAQFQEFWRILKPGGLFVASCPMWDSPWAWSDPGHRRVLSRFSLAFLVQAEYERQVGKTHMTDYRHVYTADFEVLATKEDEHSWGFVLRATK